MRTLLCIVSTIILTSCSNYIDYHFVSYQKLVGTNWYVFEKSRNRVDQYTFLQDSVIVTEYTYSPIYQKDGMIEIFPYDITSTLVFKGKVENKDRIYQDGDDDRFYVFDVFIKPYNGSAPVTGWVLSETWFAWDVCPDKLLMGKIDEYSEVQQYYELSSTRPEFLP